MKKTILSLMAISAIAMVGCKSTKEKNISGETDNYIYFSTISGDIQSKAVPSTDAFVNGDKVGIYVIARTAANATPQSPMTSAHAENVVGTADGSNGLAVNPAITYPAGNNIDVYAYYPQNSSANTGTNGEKRTTSINADQQTENAYKQSDFKVARNINWTKPASSTPVPLDFKHQMVKIDIELKNGVGIFSLDPLKNAVVRFQDVPVSGEYDFLANTFTVATAGTKANIVPFGTFEVGTGSKIDRLVGKSVILTPRTNTDADYKFHIEFDGKQHEMDINAKLEGGKSYNYLVTVNRDGISIQTSITPWVDGGELTGSTTF